MTDKFALLKELKDFLLDNYFCGKRGGHISILYEALLTARTIALTDKQTRFGAYLSEYPAHLGMAGYSALEHAFPENLVSAPVWLEYSFEDWTPPSNLLRTTKANRTWKEEELLGNATTPSALLEPLRNSRQGHLLFQVKEEGKPDTIGCFSCFLPGKKLKQSENQDEQSFGLTFTPIISFIDKNGLLALQNELSSDKNQTLDIEKFNKIKIERNLRNDKYVMFPIFQERLASDELKRLILRLPNKEVEESLRHIYMNVVSHSTLDALSALSISQCYLSKKSSMPGYLKIVSPLRYMIFKYAFKWSKIDIDRNAYEEEKKTNE